MRASYRSLITRRLSIDSRAYVISQHARWPIRYPRPTCANQDAWVVITAKRLKANSIHTAPWHAWTRTPPLNIVQKAVFSLIRFPALFICLCPSGHFDSGVETWLGVIRRTNRFITRLVKRDVNSSTQLYPLIYACQLELRFASGVKPASLRCVPIFRHLVTWETERLSGANRNRLELSFSSFIVWIDVEWNHSCLCRREKNTGCRGNVATKSFLSLFFVIYIYKDWT